MCDLSGNGNHMFWSSDAAPLYTTFNGYGVLRTTPIVATQSAISTQTYNSLQTGSQPFSVVAMFKPNSITPHKIFFTAGNPSGGYGQTFHSIAINDESKYVGGAWGTLGTWGSKLGTDPSTSEYVMMVTTFDGTTESVYINGVLEKSAAMTLSIPVSASNNVVLGCSFDPTASMDADIGVLLMYNRALSSSDITQIYSAYAPRFVLTGI